MQFDSPRSELLSVVEFTEDSAVSNALSRKVKVIKTIYAGIHCDELPSSGTFSKEIFD